MSWLLIIATLLGWICPPSPQNRQPANCETPPWIALKFLQKSQERDGR